MGTRRSLHDYYTRCSVESSDTCCVAFIALSWNGVSVLGSVIENPKGWLGGIGTFRAVENRRGNRLVRRRAGGVEGAAGMDLFGRD